MHDSEAGVKGSKGDGKGGNDGGKGGGSPGPGHNIPFEVQSHEASRYMPPGCQSCPSRPQALWRAWVSPYKRIYEYIRTGGEQAALKRIYQRSLNLYIEREGLTRADCPWTNLWKEAIVKNYFFDVLIFLRYENSLDVGRLSSSTSTRRTR